MNRLWRQEEMNILCNWAGKERPIFWYSKKNTSRLWVTLLNVDTLKQCWRRTVWDSRGGAPCLLCPAALCVSVRCSLLFSQRELRRCFQLQVLHSSQHKSSLTQWTILFYLKIFLMRTHLGSISPFSFDGTTWFCSPPTISANSSHLNKFWGN